MTAMNHGSLRLLLASSAATVNLLSKFEPALAHVDTRKLTWNEDKRNNKLKNGQILFPNSRKQERKREISTILNDYSHAAVGALKNVKLESQAQKSPEITECDPDVGILTCGEGEHCKRRPNGGVGGVCVASGQANEETGSSTLGHFAVAQSHLLHQRKHNRKLQGCDASEVEMYVYIGYDEYSNGYVDVIGAVANENFWSAESESGTVISPYQSFPYEAPVEGTYCFPLGETIKISIYDTADDGIDPAYNIAGLAVNIEGYTDFVLFESPGFFEGGLFESCFECSDSITCAEVPCPTEPPTGAPTAAPTPTSTTTMPTTTAPTAPLGPTTSPSARPSPAPSTSPAPTPITASSSKSSKKSSKAPGKGKGGSSGTKSSKAPGSTSKSSKAPGSTSKSSKAPGSTSSSIKGSSSKSTKASTVPPQEGGEMEVITSRKTSKRRRN